MNDKIHAVSSQDPCGFMFSPNRKLFCQDNQRYRTDYDLLMSSGSYKKLATRILFIEHDKVSVPPAKPSLVKKIIEPANVVIISYPNEKIQPNQ